MRGIKIAAVLALTLGFGSPALAGAKGSTHPVAAEIVSVDAAGKKLTLKLDNGETVTGKVEGKAIGELKDLKAGQKVTVTCRDNKKGEHQAITGIKAN